LENALAQVREQQYDDPERHGGDHHQQRGFEHVVASEHVDPRHEKGDQYGRPLRGQEHRRGNFDEGENHHQHPRRQGDRQSQRPDNMPRGRQTVRPVHRRHVTQLAPGARPGISARQKRHPPKPGEIRHHDDWRRIVNPAERGVIVQANLCNGEQLAADQKRDETEGQRLARSRDARHERESQRHGSRQRGIEQRTEHLRAVRIPYSGPVRRPF
jgi:hypothetical protein